MTLDPTLIDTVNANLPNLDVPDLTAQRDDVPQRGGRFGDRFDVHAVRVPSRSILIAMGDKGERLNSSFRGVRS
jgi:hypothetical protein